MRRLEWGAAALMVFGSLGAGSARAQSEPLLESVRLHRPDARALAEQEWRQCEAAPKACPEVGSLALLLASLELSAGNSARARELLRATPPPPILKGHHAYLLGQAHFYTQDPASAAKAFALARKHGSPSLSKKATLRHAEALLAAGRAAEALAIFEREPRAAHAPEVRRQRAEARAKLGKTKDAVLDLRALAIRHPAHPASADVLPRLRELTGSEATFSFEESLDRAEALLAAGQEKRALTLLDAIKPADPRASARLALPRAQALYGLGKDAEAQAAVALAKKGDRRTAASAALLLARRAMKLDAPETPALLRAVDEGFQDTPHGEEAAFFEGWLHFQRGRFAAALEAFERFDERYGRSRRRDEIHWYRGLALLRLERPLEASAVMRGIVSTWPRSTLVPQARYWDVRARQLAGHKAETLTGDFAALVNQYPATFYARLAEVRLRELEVEPPRAFASPPVAIDAKPPASLALALALARAGLFPDAIEEVQAEAVRVRGVEQAMAFGHSLRALGEFGQAYSVAARHLWGRAFGAREGDALSLLYPLAWESSVRKAAEGVKIDPFFVWSIMRRESAFKDWVSSAADARGLMQIIPPTGVMIAKALEEPKPSPDALFAPSLNIRYGAWYLSALLTRFGHPALAAAAYNAGPGVVVKWAKEKKGLPLDLFVEEIPYRETRGYVKQVIADLHVYHSLYGKPGTAPKLALELPVPLAAGVAF